MLTSNKRYNIQQLTGRIKIPTRSTEFHTFHDHYFQKYSLAPIIQTQHSFLRLVRIANCFTFLTWRYVNSVNLILKMDQSFGEQSSPGKIYKIKLFEKEIKVQLVYKSPPKSKKPSKYIVESIILQRNREKSMSILANATAKESGDSKKKARRLGQPQKQFYAHQIQQSKNVLEKYQKFHNLMLEHKTQARLKVYSNPKLLSLSQHKNSNIGCVPVRKVSITSNVNNNVKQTSVKKLMKIKLFASRKKRPECQKTPDKQIKSQQKHQVQRQSEGKNLTLTPRRSRKYKLEVTTSISRGKNDSIISNHEFSKQIDSIKLKNHRKQLLNRSQQIFLPENSIID